ncbi:winged helix-turn-helix domain-containing protein [Phenylobacterium sp.]|uniref:winged helix-turn-helix domain-containing protein n=1 Tax=Phenylobacterium sp. TaxID=1871053 RepID=UPI001213BD31|nr:MAG: hypothetical protein E8A49_04100 [Phenylobacterium sp.]
MRLGSRAIAILVTLVERAGELVTKQHWRTTTVTDANLTVHMVALRRAPGQGNSGERCILNVPGRGYRFAARARTSA